MTTRNISESGFRREYEHAARGDGAFVTYLSAKEKRGVPDLYMCREGISIWLELKFAGSMVDTGEERKRSGGSKALEHPVTGLQMSFLRNVNKHGGCGMVAIGYLGERKGIEVAYFFPNDLTNNGNISISELVNCKNSDNLKIWGGVVWKISSTS